MYDFKKQLFKDLFLLVISIGVAIFFIKTGFADKFVVSLDGLKWLGIIFAGLFFTSIFTSAPSIVLLGVFSQNTPLLVVAILGGLGAVIGDYIIFSFVKSRISKNLELMLASSPNSRMSLIFKKELFKFFLPFLGAIIIASPLPDEIGVIMLGVSKMSKKRFILLTFILNSLGIFFIAWMAKTIIGF